MSELYESKERPTPYPTAWAVRCPCCETEMEFEVQEDDSGAFGFDAANIPVCEPCSVMFFPETVQVSVVTECATCGGTGMEGRHSICRDCDEAPAPQPHLVPEKGVVYVEVSGLTGSGKSAVMGEIEIALRAIGIVVEHEKEFQSEKNMTHADWQPALDLYKPRVKLLERNILVAAKGNTQ